MSLLAPSRSMLAPLAPVALCAAACTGGALLTVRFLPDPVEAAAAAAGIALLCVVPTVFALRRSFRSVLLVGGELQRKSVSPSDLADLRPIPAIDPVSRSWNDLVDVVDRQEALQRVSERLRETIGGLKRRECDQVLDSLPDGVAVTAGRVVRFSNRSLSSLLRIPEGEDLNGRSVDALLQLDAEDLERLTASDRAVVFESMLGNSVADGVLRIARNPLSDGNGTATHVWTVRDVTQQKLAEAMRDNFVSSATHELRTPLANIKAYSETLAMLDVTDIAQQKEFCNIIDSEVSRLSRFVDDLLSIDQMESGALSLVRSETDVARLVEDVCEKVRPQMVAKDVRFETTFPKKFPKLKLDKDKFAAALVNLLGNAAKYTPEGGVVRFTIENAESILRFHVEDTGIGIAADEVERVFDKFFRSDDDRVRDVAGNGLGLAFTREVVRLHGGDVTVHSELDKGTNFTVTMAT